MNQTTKNLLLSAAVAGIIGGLAVSNNAEAKDAKKKEKKIHCGGVNECKGKSECHTATTKCAGSNECKGKGWIAMTEKACKDKGGKEVVDGHNH
jgi:uncharacterized membrane protein